MGGFKRFLLRGNLGDLAVAFVIGAAFASCTRDVFPVPGAAAVDA